MEAINTLPWQSFFPATVVKSWIMWVTMCKGFSRTDCQMQALYRLLVKPLHKKSSLIVRFKPNFNRLTDQSTRLFLIAVILGRYSVKDQCSRGSYKAHSFSSHFVDLYHWRCNQVYLPWVNKGNRRTQSALNVTRTFSDN